VFPYIRTITSLIFFLLFTARLHAQLYNFKLYGLDEGLSQSQVTALCQDREGYVWLGTEGGGLNRFDGKTFVNYTVYDGLPSNLIWELHCDRNGMLWIGTLNGLCTYNGRTFQKIQTSFGYVDDEIEQITEDVFGNIWIGTSKNGVIRYDGTQYKKFAIIDGIGFSDVSSLFAANDGKVWVGSSKFGLAVWDGNKFENVTSEYRLNDPSITEITENEKGEIIVIGEKGSYILKNNKFITLDFPGVNEEDITEILHDRNGGWWLGTYSSGIYYSTTKETIHFREENGLPSDYVLCLFEDMQGNVWIGTDGAGSCLFSGTRFIHYNKYSGLKNNLVKAIAKDSSGRFWFGTERGLSMLENGTFTHYTNESGLNNENVHSLYPADKSDIWIGTDDGVSRIKDGEFTHYRSADGKEIGSVLCIFPGMDKKNFLIGTEEAIYQLKGNQFVQRFRDSIPEMRVFNLRKIRGNELWICHDKGITVFNGKSFRFDPLIDEFGSRDALDCLEDEQGNIWIITGRGIVIRKPDGTVDNVKRQQGISSDNIYLLCSDGRYVWIGTDRGLDRIYLNEKGMIKEIRHYGKYEGFTGLECNGNASFVDTDRSIWFGTIKGATKYIPDNDLLNTTPPPVKITGMKLWYQFTDWKTRYNYIAPYTNVPQNIVLSHNDNHLTFEFIAFEFTNPEKVMYQFFLDGFDETWSPETPDHYVTYSNLPPGDYSFKVRAANSDGFWSNAVVFSFSIDAPFWKKTWFYVMIIPLLLIILYLIIVLRTRQLNLAKRSLEEKVRLRTMELNRQKEELEKLSLVASHMNEGVLILNHKGEIEWVNESFYRMSGYSNEQSFKESHYGKVKSIQELSSLPGIATIVEGFKTNDNAVVYDSTHLTGENMKIWTRGSLVPVYNEKELFKIIAIFTDITDRKTAETALEQSNKDLLDSIRYGSRIQQAILPSMNELKDNFPDSFIYYQPRDIVSGDFYWFSAKDGYFMFAVSDCTGHGVPGAFMSIIGNEFLNQITRSEYIIGPEQALHFLDKQFTRSLHQEGTEKESRDGMDIGLCAIRLEDKLAQFSGANIPLYLVREGEVKVYDAQKESIGGFTSRNKEFYAHEFPLMKGDMIYLTTDGFVDQFGGPEGKKFMRKRFRDLISRISSLPSKDQKNAMKIEFENWKGNKKQTDDILVIAIRI
jgi:PAS domain S-box-containing protein